MAVDPPLLHAWLAGRSLARGLPEPVPDCGGFRVDTNSDKELRRWVFPIVRDGLCQLGSAIREPRQLIKLCGPSEELASALPDRWTVEATGSFMSFAGGALSVQPLPFGYTLNVIRDGPVSRVEIRSESDELAASGYGAETGEAFVYDRIETAAAHRRRGLGRAVMAALSACRRSDSVQQLLVATPQGERLYAHLGWHTLSVYSTAQIVSS